MAFRRGIHPPRRQRGLALLILLMIVSLSASYLLLKTFNKSSSTLAVTRNNRTQVALMQAKQALLTYAATVGAEKSMDLSKIYPGVPGYLPCPDLGASMTTTVAEGQAASTCGSPLVSQIGRLPWYSLGLDALKDSSGECLWYAVSGTYKAALNGVTGVSTSNMMNWDTRGLFDVFADGGVNYLTGGSNPATRAVAVIFAPGARLNAQDRTPTAVSSPNTGAPNCGGNYTVASYLESANGVDNTSVVSSAADTIVQFIAGNKSDTFNDQLVYITREELWTAIKKRPDFQDYLTGIPNGIAYKVASCLANFGNNNQKFFSNGDRRLPSPAAVSLSITTLSTYMLDASYDDVDLRIVGRVPFLVNNSRSGSGSTRPINNLLSPYYLFSLTSSSTNCYSLLSNADIAWYENWKDHLFYAVSNAYRPRATPNTPVATCDTTNCIQVGGSAMRYAGVVIFAGERNSSQSRETATDRSLAANYLEGANSSNISLVSPGGNENYVYTSPGVTPFNDTLYCILTNYQINATPPNPYAPPYALPVLCP